MKAKLTSKLTLQIIYIIILSLALINPHYAIANNVSTKVPRGGLPVLAKSFPTYSGDYLYSITSNGTHLFCTSVTSDDVFIYTIQGTFVKTFGSSGSGNGQFSGINDILYANGQLYVSDTGNNRIEVFSTNGNYLSQFGSSGSGDGQFNGPTGIAIYSNNLYITDTSNFRVQVFDLQGSFIRSFGSHGKTPNQFEDPEELTIAKGRVYVSDFILQQVKVWDTSGNFLFQFSNSGLGWNTLSSPLFIAASNNFVYVGNYYLNSILVFDLNGNYECEYNGSGSGPGTFNYVSGLVIQNSILYGIDVNGHQINEFVFLNPPLDLNAYTGIDSISLVWQKPQYSEYIDISSYQIYRSTNGSTFRLFATSTSEYFTDNLVTPGGTYYYKITAVAKNGFVGVSDFSSMVKVTVPKITTSTNGGFLPFNITFGLIGILTISLLVKKRSKNKQI